MSPFSVEDALPQWIVKGYPERGGVSFAHFEGTGGTLQSSAKRHAAVRVFGSARFVRNVTTSGGVQCRQMCANLGTDAGRHQYVALAR
jgi:hypothetical protein